MAATTITSIIVRSPDPFERGVRDQVAVLLHTEKRKTRLAEVAVA